MHYGLRDFSTNGLQTISLASGRTFDGVIGQREKLSDIDLLQLRLLYSCPSKVFV